MTYAIIITALTIGIAGSLHCVGMCGPIVLSLPMVQPNGNRRLNFGTLNYFLGKTFAYGVMGLLFGLLGQQIVMAGFQRSLSIGIGILMLLFALFAIFKPAVLHHNPLSLFMGRQLSPVMGKLLRTPGQFSTLVIGFLNGFLPCGLVYIALGAAVAIGNSWYAALFMILFGIATIPGLLLLALFNNKLNAAYRSKMRRVLPWFTAIIAVLLILRGMDLGIPFISPQVPDSALQQTGEPVICH